jgi:hypothetical protein
MVPVIAWDCAWRTETQHTSEVNATTLPTLIRLIVVLVLAIYSLLVEFQLKSGSVSRFMGAGSSMVRERGAIKRNTSLGALVLGVSTSRESRRDSLNKACWPCTSRHKVADFLHPNLIEKDLENILQRNL